jgi:glycosyltransferase involved in cell wall biosynthesis
MKTFTNNNLKVSLVVDWLEEFGGSERVILTLIEIFPDAHLWTLWNNNNQIQKLIGSNIHESYIGKLPKKLRRPIAMLLAIPFWRNLNFSNHDLVIVVSHQFAHTVRFRNSNCNYFYYILTPIRYVWNPEIDTRLKFLRRTPFMRIIRYLDSRYAPQENLYAISGEIQNRIKANWKVNSGIIYPPVSVKITIDDKNVDVVTLAKLPPKYLVAAGRWIKYKNFDKSISVAKNSSMPIVILGGGPEKESLKKFANLLNAEVVFIENPNRDTFLRIIELSEAFIFPALEDFGITPIESMALGTPVIGLNFGGLSETVVHGVSGFLANDANELVQFVARVGMLHSESIMESVQKFSPARFQKEIINALKLNH